MRRVVDANILVAELLRTRGQALVAHPTPGLRIAESIWDEAEYELRKRIALRTVRGTLTADVAERVLEAALVTANDWVVQVPQAIYDMREVVARARILRDPDDWHTVALALAADADIWTADADFLGCGIATWTTDTLLAHLAYVEAK